MSNEETPQQRRARQRRERYAALTPEQKAERLAKNRAWTQQWRTEHPEEYEAEKKRKAEQFIERYRSDPEFRAKRQEYLRSRYTTKKNREPSPSAEGESTDSSGTSSA